MSNAREDSGDRRRATRVNSTLSLTYQRITALEARLDPYDPRFELPRHFTLAEELAQVDDEQKAALSPLLAAHPELQVVLDNLDRKLRVLAQAIEGSLSQVISPLPQRVNLSESGLSFHAGEPLLPGLHLHLAISNTGRNYHVAATGRVVFCEDEDLEGFRTGVAFISLRDDDRLTLARDVTRKAQEYEVVESFLNPENG